MKKLMLFVLLGLIIQPVHAGTYTKIGNGYIYSNSPVNYSITSLRPVVRRQTDNSEALSAMLAGAGLATGRISLLNTPSLTGNAVARAFMDPYIININNQNYVLVRDNKDNNWTVENILGYNDSKEDLFASLKQLESDGNNAKITSDELKKANIRFVLLNKDQSLALNERNLDFNLSKVQYIDMKNLRTALGNKNQDGTFGYFYVIIKDKNINRAYPGRVTFEDKQELSKYIK